MPVPDSKIFLYIFWRTMRDQRKRVMIMASYWFLA